jgi:uncharacterized YccA/Bax inhibitor family protein
VDRLEVLLEGIAALPRRKKIVYGVALALALTLVWLESRYDILYKVFGR